MRNSLTGVSRMTAAQLARSIAREVRRADVTLGVTVEANMVVIDADGRWLKILVQDSLLTSASATQTQPQPRD